MSHDKDLAGGTYCDRILTSRVFDYQEFTIHHNRHLSWCKGEGINL